MRIVFFDTEATGLSTTNDQIIEIGAYDPVGKRKFFTYVKPTIAISENATTLHNVTDEFLADAPSFKEAMASFVKFCDLGDEKVVLVSHNNDGYHKVLLEQECQRHNMEMPQWKMMDTLNWSRKLHPEIEFQSLSALAEVFEVVPVPSHRALEDAIALSKLFAKITGNRPVQELVAMYDQPTFFSRMPWGEHRGMQIRELPTQYVDWLRVNRPTVAEFVLRDASNLWPHGPTL